METNRDGLVQALKKIPEFEDYGISCDGAVWSSPRNGRKGRWLKHDIHRQGYHRIALCKQGKMFGFLVHRLVALVWLGPPPFDGAKVLHEDDDPHNNHFSNLYYGTQSQNMRDAMRNGKWSKEKGHCSSYGV